MYTQHSMGSPMTHKLPFQLPSCIMTAIHDPLNIPQLHMYTGIVPIYVILKSTNLCELVSSSRHFVWLINALNLNTLNPSAGSALYAQMKASLHLCTCHMYVMQMRGTILNGCGTCFCGCLHAW